MMSCSTSGAPIPMRSRNSGSAGVLTRGVDDEFGRHHVKPTAVLLTATPMTLLAAAVEDEVGDLGLVTETDPWFVVEAAPHTPFEQRPSGAHDLDVAGAGLLPGAAQPDAVLSRHVDLERALAHHVVDDAGEEALQLDLACGEQMVQVPALCRTRPALAASGADRPSPGR